MAVRRKGHDATSPAPPQISVTKEIMAQMPPTQGFKSFTIQRLKGTCLRTSICKWPDGSLLFSYVMILKFPYNCKIRNFCV
jgi:hypothetical protein